MTNKQVKSFFIDKENADCSITNRLIAGGYRQTSGGYISYAKQMGISNPTQYWHLITSWCNRSAENAPFNKSIQCGELLFWMAEVSGAVSKKSLNDLCDLVLRDYRYNRKEGNRIIQNVCFNRISDKLSKSTA